MQKFLNIYFLYYNTIKLGGKFFEKASFIIFFLSADGVRELWHAKKPPEWEALYQVCGRILGQYCSFSLGKSPLFTSPI